MTGTVDLARRAATIGRLIGDADVELSAMALEGMALASQGRIAEGTRMLDEARRPRSPARAPSCGRSAAPAATSITACERIRDFERAAQWSERMLEFARRWRVPHLFAVCRALRGGPRLARRLGRGRGAAEGDREAARHCFEAAVELFQRSGAPFETAQARLQLAGALAALGRRDAAAPEAGAARDAMLAVQAVGAVERADALLGEIRGEAARASRLAHGPRGRGPAARGPGPDERRDRRTPRRQRAHVHRRLANIVAKLGLSSRAAAAVRAAQHGLV